MQHKQMKREVSTHGRGRLGLEVPQSSKFRLMQIAEFGRLTD